jgi:hypothetical protein
MSRVLASALLAILLGCYIDHLYSTWSRRGRAEFVAQETTHFDQFIDSPRPMLLTIAGAGLITFSAVGLYELAVLMFSTVLRQMKIRTDDK